MPGYTQLWTSSYHGLFGDLPNVPSSAGGFYNAIGVGTHGAVVDQRFSNEDAYDALIQGSVTDVCERHELLHIIGHSSSEGPEFSVRDRNNGVAEPGEVKWGGQALRWVVIDGCFTLNPRTRFDGSTDILARWGQAFGGIRGLFGFASECSCEPTRGRTFAKHLLANEPIWLAWMKACQESDDADFAVLTVLETEGALTEIDGASAAGDHEDDHADVTVTRPVLPDDTWPQVGEAAAVDVRLSELVYFSARV